MEKQRNYKKRNIAQLLEEDNASPSECLSLIHDVIEYYESLSIVDLPQNIDICALFASTSYWQGLIDGSNHQ
ncbi:hypothetical protein LL255_06635 [Enterococcus hirae]|uniref:hypothetical protein n=1 Tax=Enterococcus hirae TaxID=1354 RepID=UPI00162A66E5|nr:hypothetical protein [Enterococcus hirae]MCC4034932.1 hypothetical protein [Enterococcus hirae]QNG04550.1 hypothetical protein FQ488_01975 [Enterococcus hirae]